MGTQTKDIESFNRVYSENKELIFKTAMKFSENYHTAQEITQNTFLKLYSDFDKYELDYTVKWLVKTAKNAAINCKKKASFESPEIDIALTSEIHGYADSTEDIAMKKIHDEEIVRLKDDILQSLYELNERWYDAMTMIYCMERSQQDVADELGVSIEVLHSVLYRARTWIKKNYTVWYETTKYL